MAKGSNLKISGFLFSGIIFLITAVWILVPYASFRKEIRTTRAKINELVEKAKKDVPEAQILKAQKEVDSLSIVLAKKEKRVYPLEDLPNLGIRIAKIAEAYDIKLVSIKPGFATLIQSTGSGETMTELPVSFQFRGRFFPFTRFLESLDSLPFAFRVDHMLLSRSMDTTKVKIPTIDAELKGVIFLKKMGAISKEEGLPVAQAGEKEKAIPR